MSYSEESGDLAELVQKLHEPWSRRAARQKLVAARAVGTLLDCLDSTNNNHVNWWKMRAEPPLDPTAGPAGWAGALSCSRS